MFGLLNVLSVGFGSVWTLVLGGDVMTNGIPGSQNPFQAIGSIVRKADLAYANLEIPLTHATTRTTRKTAAELARRAQYILKGDPKHASHLSQAGFDTVSLANNHAMDFRTAGLKEMLGLLDKNRIRHFGAGPNLQAAIRPSVSSVAGVRVGWVSFLAFMSSGSLYKCTPAGSDTPGISVLDFGGKVDRSAQSKIREVVSKAERTCDVLFVALHWGIERATVPSSYQVALARGFIDAGADGVFGSHPHVLQGSELYQGKPILYSMGNLVSPRPGSTALYRLKYDGKRYLGMEVFPCRISGGKVSPLSGAAAASEKRRIAGLELALKRRYPQGPTARSSL